MKKKRRRADRKRYQAAVALELAPLMDLIERRLEKLGIPIAS